MIYPPNAFERSTGKETMYGYFPGSTCRILATNILGNRYVGNVIGPSSSIMIEET